MGLRRFRYEVGVRSVVCPSCYRASPITKMTKVQIIGSDKVEYVCPTIGGYAGSCEAKYYSSDIGVSDIKKQFKEFSW